MQAIGYRLEELLEKEVKDQSCTVDENKKRQLRLEDEEEDFLDEGIKLFNISINCVQHKRK